MTLEQSVPGSSDPPVVLNIGNTLIPLVLANSTTSGQDRWLRKDRQAPKRCQSHLKPFSSDVVFRPRHPTLALNASGSSPSFPLMERAASCPPISADRPHLRISLTAPKVGNRGASRGSSLETCKWKSQPEATCSMLHNVDVTSSRFTPTPKSEKLGASPTSRPDSMTLRLATPFCSSLPPAAKADSKPQKSGKVTPRTRALGLQKEVRPKPVNQDVMEADEHIQQNEKAMLACEQHLSDIKSLLKHGVPMRRPPRQLALRRYIQSITGEMPTYSFGAYERSMVTQDGWLSLGGGRKSSLNAPELRQVSMALHQQSDIFQ
mmetsp:Transcript_19790/g.35293  ORF Transcript_19790/g.35293 Transcript_19790/m.35293 type:complete len:320 (-) Transcript_19790:207-1166(-)